MLRNYVVKQPSQHLDVADVVARALREEPKDYWRDALQRTRYLPQAELDFMAQVEQRVAKSQRWKTNRQCSTAGSAFGTSVKYQREGDAARESRRRYWREHDAA